MADYLPTWDVVDYCNAYALSLTIEEQDDMEVEEGVSTEPKIATPTISKGSIVRWRQFCQEMVMKMYFL